MSALIPEKNKFDPDLYEGWMFEESDGLNRVYAVGKTAREAIRAWAAERGVGEVDVESFYELDGDPKWHWGYGFNADGTSFKAAGQEVPGGVVLTWWK